MYHVPVHSLAERVLGHIREEELLRAGERVGVAVSGGLDSVALLRLLIELRHELGIVLSVVHFNHKLRGAESESDQDFVAGLAREYGLEIHCASGDVAQRAAEEGSGLEAAARELRYGFFRRLLGADDGIETELDLDVPQGLKPESLMQDIGTAEATALQNPDLAAAPAVGTSGAKAQDRHFLYRSAGSAAPPQNETVPDRSAAPPQNETGPAIPLSKIATGHTLDDQAETVLMRLIRGTGLRGLGGIYPRIMVENDVEHVHGESYGEIVRPLLGIRRSELENYLADLKQAWREDSTNASSKFTRNRVRHFVLPLLEREFNPAVVESFSELAEIARDEEDYWENEISGWLGTVVQWSQPEWTRGLAGFDLSQPLVQIEPSRTALQNSQFSNGELTDPELLARLEEPGPAVMNVAVSRPWLVTEPRAVQRRVLKAIGERVGIPLEFKHIEEILRFVDEDGPAGKELSLPVGWKIVRESESMVFVTPDLRRRERIPDYEYPLPVPGRAIVPELGVVIEALRLTPESRSAEYNPQQLLRADSLPGSLMVRNWRPGDRFWPAHTKSPKKVKELLQERHVVQPVRRLWPVAASQDEIVWMRGFPVPARLRATVGQEAFLIRETPWPVEENTI